MFNLVTLDGYFEGSQKWDLAWHNVDQEFDKFSVDQLSDAGGLIFGRVTYEGMASFWQSAVALEIDPVAARLMNALPKYVFSKTLKSVAWENTNLVSGDAVDELQRLKAEPGKDLFVFGSADLSFTFIKNHLIDEYRLMVNPIILGMGVPLFKTNGEPNKLKLIQTRSFENGNVLLYYSSQ